ncbi:MAG TPA: hypothetical protein VK699_19910 [Terriglobales bacterium]|jgi:hypothetical protein|nr:hypothetical protein [Terriglobales bacterium]
MKSKLQIAILGTVSVLTLGFAIFVWPTRYEYYNVSSANILVRRDRLTGQVERVPINQELFIQASAEQEQWEEQWRHERESTVIQKNGTNCVKDSSVHDNDNVTFSFKFPKEPLLKPKGADNIPWCKQLQDSAQSASDKPATEEQKH